MTTAEVDVPQVGPVNKRIVAGVGVSLAGFVGFRYWQAKKTAAATAATATTVDPTNPDFTATGDPSTVLGAVSPTNSFGSTTGATTALDSGDTSSYGFHGTTDDQWTQYAATQLQQSDQWSYTDIVTALGLYLSEKPTTSAQQQIISAAVAVAGHPPTGAFVLINAPTPTIPNPTAPTPTPTPTPTRKTTTYTVKKGDTQHAVDQMFGMSYGELTALNPVLAKPGSKIHTGQKLTVYVKG